MSSARGSECRVYVGNLPPDIRTKDVEDIFYKYGKIVFIDLKNSRGPPFAFVEFDDPKDAEDAVYARDGYDYDGYKLRVEFPKGGGGSFRGGAGGGRGRGPPAKRSQYRVLITGLPPTGSWQDLKDHMREAGDVAFADVFKDGTGAVEFTKYEDMKYALRKLDDSKFKSHEGETAYVRVKEDGGTGGGARRSRSHEGGKGAKKSRSRSRSGSRRSAGRSRASPTYSPVRKARSFSRSKSRGSRSRSRS